MLAPGREVLCDRTVVLKAVAVDPAEAADALSLTPGN
jgi:hypothetical protein